VRRRGSHNRLIDGGDVVSLTRQPAALYPQEHGDLIYTVCIYLLHVCSEKEKVSIMKHPLAESCGTILEVGGNLSACICQVEWQQTAQFAAVTRVHAASAAVCMAVPDRGNPETLGAEGVG
jgi:hypothetical protein